MTGVRIPGPFRRVLTRIAYDKWDEYRNFGYRIQGQINVRVQSALEAEWASSARPAGTAMRLALQSGVQRHRVMLVTTPVADDFDWYVTEYADHNNPVPDRTPERRKELLAAATAAYGEHRRREADLETSIRNRVEAELSDEVDTMRHLAWSAAALGFCAARDAGTPVGEMIGYTRMRQETWRELMATAKRVREAAE